MAARHTARSLRTTEVALAWPGATFAAFALAIGVALAGLPRLELRTDGQALVPHDSAAVRYDAWLRSRFGWRDPIVVVLSTTHPDGILRVESLRRLRALTSALAALPGVGPDAVTSLATERGDHPEPGTQRFRRLLDPAPRTEADVARVRADLDAIQLFDGTLVSYDRSAAMVLVGAPSAPYDARAPARVARGRLCEWVRQVAAPFATEGHDVMVVGAPVAESQLGEAILRDLATLVPLGLAAIVVVLALTGGRLVYVLLGLAEVGATLAVTFGAMGWAGVPVYLPTAVLPVVLIAMALADDIHVVWAFRRGLVAATPASPGAHPGCVMPDGETVDGVVHATFAVMARPVTLTSITTAVGFLTFRPAGLVPVAAFGTFAAAGILFAMAWTLLLLPAALRALPARWLVAPARSAARADRVGPWLARRMRPLVARPVVVWRGALALAVVAGVGVLGLRVQDGWLANFPAQSRVRFEADRANRAMHGVHVLQVHLELEAPGPRERLFVPYGRGPFLRPEVLEATGRLEARLRAEPGVGGVLGPYAHATAVRFLWYGRHPGTRTVAATPERMAQLVEVWDRGRGRARRREVLHDDMREAIVTVFLRDANVRDTARLLRAIRRHTTAELGTYGARVHLGGDVAVSQAMVPAIVWNQLASVALGLVGVVACVLVAHRSLHLALLAAAPAAAAVLCVFGWMGFSGVPLGVATSTFAAISLGIGVDYAVHLLESWRRAGGEDAVERALAAVAEAGPPILADAVAVAAGFGVLALSDLPPNAHLGELVAGTLLAAAGTTLVGLGTLLAARPGALLGRSALDEGPEGSAP